MAVVALVLLTVTAGCLAFVTGGGEPDDATLDREPAEPYEFDSDRDALLTLHTASEVQVVYRVEANDTFRFATSSGLGTEEPLDIAAVRFQYQNGTVINGTTLRDSADGDIDQTPDEVFVTVPADGKLAFSASATPRRFSMPAHVEGSYAVILPPSNRIDFFLFSNTAPGGAQSEVIDDRVHVTWDEVSGGTIVVQYYQQRDLFIFGGAVVILSVVALGGLYYYRKKIDALYEARIEMGLDTEVDEEREDERRKP